MMDDFGTYVVRSRNTSTLLEASVIGLPVIIPYFKDLQNQKYDERLIYRDAYDLFDITKDVKELEMMILKRLRNQVIDKKVMRRREVLFEDYISTLWIIVCIDYLSVIQKKHYQI
jgi:hypothetical protein